MVLYQIISYAKPIWYAPLTTKHSNMPEEVLPVSAGGSFF
jgi:hypothetical protein